MITDLCMHCRKPVERKKAGQQWKHSETKDIQCEPGKDGTNNAFVLPAGMRMVKRTRRVMLGDDGEWKLP